MPVTSTIGAASARGFGFLGVTLSSGPFWIGQLYTGASEDISSSTATDSSGNMYVAGYAKPSGGNENFQVAKFSPTGALLWQRSLSGASTDIAYALKVDSANNVYLFGLSRQAGISKLELAKYDSSGVIQWQKAIGNATDAGGKGLAIDGSGNFYVAGYNGAVGVVAKLDSSATIQWQMQLSGISTTSLNAVAVDPAGNVCVVGESGNGAGTFYIVTALYNSSGVLQWQRTLDNLSLVSGSGCAIDTSGNVYVCGTVGISGVAYAVAAKYNSSGVLQWQRRFGSASTDIYWMGMAIDAGRNLYMAGYDTGAYPNDVAQLAKYDTNGVLQWQRTMDTVSLDAWVGVSVDSTGVMYPTGYSAVRGTPDFMFAKLPTTGALTGTYSVGGNNFTYAASSVPDLAGSLGDSVGTLTSATATLSVSNSALTDAASGLSSVTVII